MYMYSHQIFVSIIILATMTAMLTIQICTEVFINLTMTAISLVKDAQKYLST